MGLERWGWYSIGINVLLVIINLAVAVASGSLAVAAEMVHNIVDLLTSVGVLIGLKLSARKTKAFPYGLYKLENVITVGMAGMIFLTATEIVKSAFASPNREAAVNPWMLVSVALAGVIPTVFSHFEIRVGQEANSPALIASAQEYRIHGLTAGMALAALAGQLVHFPVDRIAALIIVVVIGKTGWELLANGMRVLLDASLEPDTLMRVREIILAEPAVAELVWVTGRNAGRFRFIEGQVTLRVHDLEKAEAVTRHIESRIRDSVPLVERVLLHAEPLQRTHLRYAVPLSDMKEVLSEHFGEAPYFGLINVRLSDKTIEQQEILANPYVAIEKAKGIRVAEWLVAQKCDVVLVKESLQGKGPTYVFGDAGVEMRLVQATTVSEALAEVRRGTEQSARNPALESN